MGDSKERLLGIVTALAADAHPHNIRLLAERLCDSQSTRAQVGKGTGFAQSELDHLFSAMDNCGANGQEVSGMLKGASHAYHFAKALESVDLIWTGPSTRLVPTRRTEQALMQIIDAAQDRLFITSFVAYDVASVIEALKKALARSVTVRLLLESSRGHGGRVTIDGVSTMRHALSGAEIYRWVDKEDEFMGGAVHAKIAVADESMCFISSANLTGYAMEKNMEAGVVIRGGEVPAQLHRHLGALITTRILQLVE